MTLAGPSSAVGSGRVTRLRAAFVMEQTLGHITHAENLQTALARQTTIDATWLPIPFAAGRAERLIPGYGHNWSVRASYRARRKLGRELARRPHDVVFFHTQVTALFSVGLMRRVPSVVSLDATPINFDSVGAAYGHRPPARTWLDERKYKMNREVFEAAAALVAWSEWAAASLVRDYGVARSRILVKAPGASQAYFSIGEQRLGDRRVKPAVQLLFVGGDFVRKGGPELMEAFKLARLGRRAELHIVTRDPVAETPGVVVHRGVRPNSPELRALFKSADVFVLPSRGECLSLALMEATAAGAAVISTDVGALPEGAVDGKTAIVVDPGDVHSLGAAIERLVDDDELRTRLGLAGHALAKAKFDADENNRAILDLLVSVASPAAQRSVA
jgi:glycosyltransferase involved in cell wall biosynthesis